MPGAPGLKLSFVWLLACLGSQLVACNAANQPRKLLQYDNSAVYPLFNKPSTSPNAAAGDATTSALALGEGMSVPAPAPMSAAMGPAPPATCPRISLILNSIEIYDEVINRDDSRISVQCRNKDGVNFPSVVFATTTDVVRSSAGARYRPGEKVADIGCGETISCSVSYSDSPPGSTDPAFVLLADDGCWFDYRHFTQLSYQEPLSAWTCTKPPVRYTLECKECSDPAFPWEQALALAGPPLTDSQAGTAGSPTLNSVMVIISVSVVAGAVVLVITALLLRTRRRNIEETIRMTELMARARSDGMDRHSHRRRRSLKPPAVFVVGDPSDDPPPEGYSGPIVVLHCGEGEEEEELDSNEQSEILRWPQIAIARPDVVAERRESSPEAAQAVNQDDETNSVPGDAAPASVEGDTMTTARVPAAGTLPTRSTP